MTLIDTLQDRLRQAMSRYLEAGFDPTPMLAFCRGEVDLGVVQAPEMPGEPAAREIVYKRLASFMALYGATEAVFAADVTSSEDYDNPNEDPDRRTALYFLRLPSGRRFLQEYVLEGGTYRFGPMTDEGINVEPMVRLLGEGLGWAPRDLAMREYGPHWLVDRMPGTLVGLTPIAQE